MFQINATVLVAYVLPVAIGISAGICDAWMRRIWILLALVALVAVDLVVLPGLGIRSATGTITFAYLLFSAPISLLSYAVSFFVGLAVFSQFRKTSNQDSASAPSKDKTGVQ